MNMDGSALFSLRLSLQVALTATVFVMIAGLFIAYLLAEKKFRGRALLDVLVTLPLVLPPTVTGYYLVLLLGRNGYIGRFVYDLTGWSVMFTWYAAVIASFIVSLPLMVKTARSAFESVDKRLIETARSFGHSEMDIICNMLLPMSFKGIVAGVVLSFARALGEFGATLMLAGNIPGRTDTMPLAIYSLANSGQWSKANMMVIFFTVVSAFFLYVANRGVTGRAI